MVATGSADYAINPNADTLPLLVCHNQEQTFSGSKTIGASGGKVEFGPNSLTIPAGALANATVISARTVPGDTLAVDLEPHGLQFAAPVTLVLNYHQCNASPDLAVGILYTDSTLTKLLSVVPSEDHYNKWMVVGTLQHFSVYATAEARKPR